MGTIFDVGRHNASDVMLKHNLLAARIRGHIGVQQKAGTTS